MGNRRRQSDVPHPLPADFGLDDLHAALLTDDTSVLHPLVTTAQAFIILYGTKDLRTEKSITLRLEGPVVNRFRFLNLPMRPRKDPFRRGNGHLDRIKPDGIFWFFKITKNVFHG